MKLHDQIRIKASPEFVWYWLENIERMKAWNSKMISFRAISMFPPKVGYLYQVRYRLSRMETEFTGEIIRYEPNRFWMAKFSNPIGEKAKREMVVHESYELIPDGEYTLVRQQEIVENSGVPWFLKLLILFINATGKSVGKDNIYTLQQLAEKDAATKIV
jgi:hypothetical protein